MRKRTAKKSRQPKVPNGIVIVAEHEQGRIKPVTYEVIAFAKKLQHHFPSNPLNVLLLADEAANPAQELADRCGLDVTAMRIPAMTGYNGELYVQVLAQFLADMRPAFVCIAHTSQGQDYAPALAVKLKAACITGVSDLIELGGKAAFARPIYGGKVIADVQPMSPTVVITVQPFPWAGFFSPVDNPPTLNKAKAGSAVPIKFSLDGDRGLDVIAPGYPTSQWVMCDTAAPSDEIEETTTSTSGLSYDPISDQYNYVWKTHKFWSGTCRQFTLRLTDGTEHTALFKFK